MVTLYHLKKEPLKKKLLRKLSIKGYLPIDIFLENVVKHYYSNTKSLGMDFVTSPEISQMFGEMIGLWCYKKWVQAQNPSFINIVEFGPGNGTLMDDVLRSTSHITEFHKSIQKVCLIENSEGLITNQKQKLIGKWNKNFLWVDDIDKITEDNFSIIIANEFFDALPIKQFIKIGGKFEEVIIRYKDDNFIITSLETEYAKQINTLNDYQNYKENEISEVSIHSKVIINKISKKLKRAGGAALIIDYGYTEDNKKSSLQAVYRHKKVGLFENLGDADITSLVNFKNLIATFRKEKLSCQIATQSEFLQNMGITLRAQNLIDKGASGSSIAIQLKKLLDEMGILFKVIEVDVLEN